MVWICYLSMAQPSPPSRVSGHTPISYQISPQSTINMRIVADIQNNSKIILWLLMACYGIGLLCMVYATYYGGLRITDVMSNKDCQV